MIRTLVVITMVCSLPGTTKAQNGVGRDYPIIISVQFHGLTLPLRDMKSNFSNIGIGIGTEVGINKKRNWLQQVSLVWYRNRAVGNGLLFYAQNVWRPSLVSDFFGELKLGAGYLYAFRPSSSFQLTDGQWESVGRKGKGLFTIPAGTSVGYTAHTSETIIAPFASYQFMLVSGYNKSIPVVPQSLIQFGSRISVK